MSTQPNMVDAVDLFAGPGGWSHALRGLGATEIGLELDADACRTRAAAGFPTIRADVATYPPERFAGVPGLIASPPCTAFSTAGKKHGHAHGPALVAHAHACADGWHPWTGTPDPLVWLVLEPLRWALTTRPAWVALEQVPAVAPLWAAIADTLRRHGYHAATATLNAANYGVPQTRQRAILVAHRDRPVTLPPPTHARVPGILGEQPWQTMADALGWGATDRPYPTIACSNTSGGPDKEKLGGSRDRAALYAEHAAGRWLVNTGRAWQPGGDRANSQTFDASAEPARTVDGKGRWHAHVADHKEWAYDRPATTIAGRGLVPDPGANANRFNGATKSRNDGIRVELADVLVLQGFPRDYPVTGNRTSQFRQVGNAIPPPLAAAILAQVIDPAPPQE